MRQGALAEIPYVVQIAKTRAKGAVVRDCIFEDSAGFFARWKSSDARMENNVFRGNGFPIIEMQVLPSFYEGPPHTSNVTVVNNSFGVGTSKNFARHLLRGLEGHTIIFRLRAAAAGDADSTFKRVYRIPDNSKGPTDTENERPSS